MGRIPDGADPIKVQQNLDQYRNMLEQNRVGRRKRELIESEISHCEEYLDRVSSEIGPDIKIIGNMIAKLQPHQRMDLVGFLIQNILEDPTIDFMPQNYEVLRRLIY